MDRFRDLENAGQTGRKDAVLLAAVAGFEALSHPAPSDLSHFSNLFLALFPRVSDKTRRIASAALSRLGGLPDNVVCTVADQPVEVSAPFLSGSGCLSDRMLLQAIARHGAAHARAIATRTVLSPVVVSALRDLGDATVNRILMKKGLEERTQGDNERMVSEQRLRDRLRGMVLDREALQTSDGSPEQRRVLGHLLARQAGQGDPKRFTECLAIAMRAPPELAERILHDTSGRQLALVLRALRIGELHALTCLEGLFPHLCETHQGTRLSRVLLRSCDVRESRQTLDSWRGANAPETTTTHLPQTVDSPGRAALLPSTQRVRPDRRMLTVRVPVRRA